MQYLLTEEEYQTLHGEDNDDIDELEIENMKLKVTMTTFVDKISDIRVLQMPQHFGSKHLSITLDIDDIPQELMQILENKYRGHPQDPFRN